MTVRGTAVLVAAALALLAVVWVDGREIIPTAPPPTPEGPSLLGVPVGTVARIEWERDGDRLTLVRTPAGWHDAAGHSWPGDVIDVALDALTSLHPRTVAYTSGLDLAEYGLAPAGERLRVFDDTGNELLAMDIGNRNPAWTGNYARRDGGDELLLVGSLLRWELDKLRSAREPANLP